MEVVVEDVYSITDKGSVGWVTTEPGARYVPIRFLFTTGKPPPDDEDHTFLIDTAHLRILPPDTNLKKLQAAALL